MSDSNAQPQAKWVAPSAPRWLRPFALFWLFLLAGAIIYAPSLSGELIWDDAYLVDANPFFRSPIFLLETFRHGLFVDSTAAYYRPIQDWSYVWDYFLWGNNTFGFHLTNVIVHCLAAWLLCQMLRGILPGLWPEKVERALIPAVAAAVGLLWLVHPIHNAAVAYISGRADPLAAMFALGAWCLVLSGLRGNAMVVLRIATFPLAALALFLALGSKEIALTWCGLFGIWLWGFDRTVSIPRKIGLTFGVLAVVGLYAAVRLTASLPGPASAGASAPLALRVLMMFRALGDYVSLLVFPAKLHMERMIYTGAGEGQGAFWQREIFYQYLGMLGALVGLAGILWLRWRAPGRALRAFGAIWFLIGFLPISNLFPLNAQVAEHWIYMASIGAILFAAGLVLPWWPNHRRLVGAVIAIAALGLAGRTMARSFDWSNPTVFFQRTASEGGDSVRTGLNIASQKSSAGDLAGAEKILRQLVQQYPTYSPARFALSAFLLGQGRVAEAAKFAVAPKVDQSQSIWPWKDDYNRLYLELAQHDGTGCEEAVAAMAKKYPSQWRFVQLQAVLAEQSSGPAAALPFIEPYVHRYWWEREAVMAQARLREATGDRAGAINAYRHASRLDIRNGDALSEMARLDLALGHGEAALAMQKQALRREPQRPSLQRRLAEILRALNRPDEAAAAEAKAAGMEAAARQFAAPH